MSDQVKIIEVGPRDGLQNEVQIIDTSVKLKFIELLIEAGLKTIEVTSFVRAPKIPQMKDGPELLTLLNSKNIKGVDLISLVPNMIGLDNALKVDAKNIAIFTATSETFNQKNINATIDESMIKLEEVCKKASDLNIRGYVSTAFGCPYEGKTSVKKLIELINKLIKLGCYEVSIGDTIGVATPKQVKEVVSSISKEIDLSLVALHLHDTYGMGAANTMAGFDSGVRSFDSSAAGLGGCPYAKGATGNVATEDLFHLFDSQGIKTGIDIDKLVLASEYILKHLNKNTTSKFLSAYMAKK